MFRHLFFVLLVALSFQGNASNKTTTINISTWHVPVYPMLITDIFGERLEHPVTGKEGYHTGIDLRGRLGTEVYAVDDGKVITKNTFKNYGRMIKIQHKNKVSTSYSHFSKWADGIKLGDTVKKGQLLGYTGSSGRATSPHLHFEIRVDGKPIDPFPLYKKLPCKWNVEHELCSKHIIVLNHKSYKIIPESTDFE